MVGLLVIGLAVATALLTAASLRLGSLVSTLLTAYLALAANLVLVVVVLSPFRGVTRGGLAVAEAVLFVGAVGVWWLRGRPGLPLGGVRPAFRAVVGEPVAATFLVVVLVVLGYELVLALTVPPNNWDALTYHLARVGAWVQHHGIHWIPNAPTDRMNEFQPLAEQELLFLFAATGSGALQALPQYVAQLAILLAVYGASRRLGFDARAAACSAFLLATFSLVALEATTAQNDLVAASFPIVAACLLLGDRRAELALAGVAVAMGVGAKLTTVLVWPVLVLLLWRRGPLERLTERKRSRPAAQTDARAEPARPEVGADERRLMALVVAAGAGVGFVVAGMWGYVLNLIHTAHPLGDGASRLGVTAEPTFPGSLQTAIHVVYRMLDLSVLSNTLIYSLAAAGVVVATVVGIQTYRRAGPRRALLKGPCVATPLLAPVVVLAGGALIAFLTRIADIPVDDGTFFGGLNRDAHEDYSAFGPLGAILLLGVPLLTFAAYRARKADGRHVALALALPVFLLLLALLAEYNPFLTRLLLVPAVLTAPLFASFFRGRMASATVVAVASLVVGLTLAEDRMKPLEGANGRPWQLTPAQAIELTWQPEVGTALDAYRKEVPAHACVGAVVGPDDPSYLLYGPRFGNHVVYLPLSRALAPAKRNSLSYVMIVGGVAAGDFSEAGWTMKPLNDGWLLAVSPAAGAATGACSA